MNKDQVLDKIKKLLALANSSNEHEAKAASAMANKLLTKYNLTMKDCDDVDHKYNEKFFNTGKQKQPTEWKFVQSLLREFFFVEIVHTRKPITTGSPLTGDFKMKYEFCYVMFGQPHNIEIAIYIRDFLIRSFKDSFAEYKRVYKASTAARQSYYHGLYQGLHAQLAESRKSVETETGLVVVPDADLEDFVQDSMNGALTKNKNKVKINDKDAALAGYDRGKDLQISRGMNGDSSAGAGKISETLKLSGGSQ